jgi:4a-hydroxytetrahydrobiopterin dehydratase
VADELTRLTRQEVSDAVTGLGWRNVLGKLCTQVRVGSMGEAAEVASRIVAEVGADAAEHVQVDVRGDRAVVTVWSVAENGTRPLDVRIARRITDVVTGMGFRTDAEVGGSPRSVQQLEIAVDAMDIPAVRPFWKAVLGYVDEVADGGPEGALVDPFWQGPAVWFQQMDEPRVQRNRIHFDISVPHDEARRRIQATLDAGGTMVSDDAAPAFWVLADVEGNEVCVCTWEGRD